MRTRLSMEYLTQLEHLMHCKLCTRGVYMGQGDKQFNEHSIGLLCKSLVCTEHGGSTLSVELL